MTDRIQSLLLYQEAYADSQQYDCECCEDTGFEYATFEPEFKGCGHCGLMPVCSDAADQWVALSTEDYEIYLMTCSLLRDLKSSNLQEEKKHGSVINLIQRRAA